jgi:hypothetical protein
MTRAEQLRRMTPQLMADVRLYGTEEGGRQSAVHPGWGCPCMVSKAPPWEGWDGWPLLGDQTIEPGDRRRLGFVFLSPEAPEILRAAQKFYFWEGRVVGEATIVN